MNTTIEMIEAMSHVVAMKQALEALEKCSAQLARLGYSANHADQVIPALRTAIAEAESRATEQMEKQRSANEHLEPVAQDAERWGNRLNDASWAAVEAWDKDLMGPMSGAVFNYIKGVVRAAILKYLDGYTPPAAQPAPVQELERLRDENERLHVENRRLIDRIETMGVPVGVGGFLTTTNAAQRPVAEPHKWVGLTDEERMNFVKNGTQFRIVKAIEAKLREKNGGQTK